MADKMEFDYFVEEPSDVEIQFGELISKFSPGGRVTYTKPGKGPAWNMNAPRHGVADFRNLLSSPKPSLYQQSDDDEDVKEIDQFFSDTHSVKDLVHYNFFNSFEDDFDDSDI